LRDLYAANKKRNMKSNANLIYTNKHFKRAFYQETQLMLTE